MSSSKQPIREFFMHPQPDRFYLRWKHPSFRVEGSHPYIPRCLAQHLVVTRGDPWEVGYSQGIYYDSHGRSDSPPTRHLINAILTDKIEVDEESLRRIGVAGYIEMLPRLEEMLKRMKVLIDKENRFVRSTSTEDSQRTGRPRYRRSGR